MRKLRIATRQSQLALWQAEHIKAKLIALYPDLIIELIPFKTQGDIILDVSLAKIGGKGLFVKELENALLNNQADIAVHSVKDLPAQLPADLILAVYCSREEPRDALVSREGLSLFALPPNPIIGTSSLRRQSQITALRSDCVPKLLRGNVPTRIEKLMQGQYDAIVLAAAGLARLKLDKHISQLFTTEQILPAVGQGALGIECRLDDKQTRALLAPLNEANVNLCIQAERTMNARLGGSCQVPIAGYAILVAGKLRLQARVANLTGTIILESTHEAAATLESAVALGDQVADHLLQQGARKLIDEIVCE